jgi:hypothetical protein
MILHTAPLSTEPHLTAGYGSASRRTLAIAVMAIAGMGTLLVWGLSLLVG